MGYIRNKFTNARISKEFNNILSAHKLFQGESYKLISPCHYLLNKIYANCVFKNRGFVSLHHKYIQNMFRPYNVNYRPIITSLIELGLLEIKLNEAGAETYFNAENAEDSICKQYRVTDKCAELLRLGNKEYLRKLHNDPQIKKQVRRNREQRLRRLNNTGDLVIDNACKNLFLLKYKQDDVEIVKKRLIASAKDEIHAQRRIDNVDYSLINIVTGDFSINRNEKDGRIHNAWNLMNSELRPIFHLRHNGKNLFLTHIIDIRSAHPSFLAIYLKNLYLKNNNYNCKSSNFYSSLTIPHYVTDDEAYFKNNLLAEVAVWNDFWTNPKIQPRDIISKDLGITEAQVKALLNTAINDGHNKNKLHIWIEKYFPFLHSVWIRTKIKETGINISRLYESSMIRDNAFQAFVNSIQDVKVMDEHDGLSIFSDLNDAEAENKIQWIKEFLVNSCYDKFGIKPVIRVKVLNHLN